jgi:hypothetical protein
MTSNLQEKPSALKREHPALQNTKILNFSLFLRVIFALLDADPDPIHFLVFSHDVVNFSMI